jgi:phage-related protein
MIHNVHRENIMEKRFIEMSHDELMALPASERIRLLKEMTPEERQVYHLRIAHESAVLSGIGWDGPQ